MPICRSKVLKFGGALALQVSRRLERTTGYAARRLGRRRGFWGQLVYTDVVAIILAFSVAITGAATAPVTFISLNRSTFSHLFYGHIFSYTRLSQ